MSCYRNRIFPALAGLLWAAFLFLDLSRLADSTWVKFISICLCGMTALLGAHTVDGGLVAAALCLTVAADWFLLVRNDHYLVGIRLFILVQLLYALRIYRLWQGSPHPPLLLVRVALFLLCIALSPTLGPLSSVLIYFSNLCLNAAEAFALRKRAFAIGLLLFVCCDICVGAWNLGLLPGLARVGMWLFYLPSQVLIVLSQEQEKRSFDEKAV